MLSTETKQVAIKKFQKHEKDTGSAEVQVALLSLKIDALSDHLKTHRKDNHSRRGLLQLVAKRRSHLKYLEKNAPKVYETITKKLKLKK